MKCVLCENEIIPDVVSGWDQGNNAQPLADGRCCDDCNMAVVSSRMARMVGKRPLLTDEQKRIYKVHQIHPGGPGRKESSDA